MLNVEHRHIFFLIELLHPAQTNNSGMDQLHTVVLLKFCIFRNQNSTVWKQLLAQIPRYQQTTMITSDMSLGSHLAALVINKLQCQ
jgi:hypothetical protein